MVPTFISLGIMAKLTFIWIAPNINFSTLCQAHCMQMFFTFCTRDLNSHFILYFNFLRHFNIIFLRAVTKVSTLVISPWIKSIARYKTYIVLPAFNLLNFTLKILYYLWDILAWFETIENFFSAWICSSTLTDKKAYSKTSWYFFESFFLTYLAKLWDIIITSQFAFRICSGTPCLSLSIKSEWMPISTWNFLNVF